MVVGEHRWNTMISMSNGFGMLSLRIYTSITATSSTRWRQLKGEDLEIHLLLDIEI